MNFDSWRHQKINEIYELCKSKACISGNKILFDEELCAYLIGYFEEFAIYTGFTDEMISYSITIIFDGIFVDGKDKVMELIGSDKMNEKRISSAAKRGADDMKKFIDLGMLV